MQAPYKTFTSRHFRALDLYHPDCIKDLIGAFPMYLTLSWTRKERERELLFTRILVILVTETMF